MRRKIFTVFFVVLLIVIIFVGCVEEETPKDSYNTTETMSIQQLIDSASPGDVINIPIGVYNETIFINKSITLNGNNKANTIIDGMFPAIWSTGSAITINSDDVKISNFTIRNLQVNSRHPNNNCGIQINSNFNEISNNVFSKSYYGIYLNYSNNTKIINNDFVDLNDAGVYLDFSDNNNISNNEFSGSRIKLNNSCKNNTIYDNILTGENYGIMIINNGLDNKILNNEISTTDESLFIIDSSKNSIIGNTFENNGIHLSDSSNNDVSNNYVREKELIYLENKSNLIVDEEVGQIIIINSDNITVQNQKIEYISYGLYLINSEDCIISNNQFSDISTSGLTISSSDDNLIENNDFKNCRESIMLWSVNNNIIQNNEFIDCKSRSIRFYNSFYNTISNNNLGNLLLDKSDYNTIQDNTINGSIHFFYDSNSTNNIIINNNFNNYGLEIDFYTIDNTVQNNFVNGKPLIYLEDESDTVVNEDAGQVILIRCDNIIVENQEINNAFTGIGLFNTQNSTIRNNKINYDVFAYINGPSAITESKGIYLNAYSNNNVVENNVLTDNKNGIELVYYSDYNTINNNKISSGSGGAGIKVSSSNNTIKNNNLTSNYYGVSISGYYNTIFSNNFIDYIFLKETDDGTNRWDNGSVGNYYDKYAGVDNDGDGIGDNSYNADNYPLMNPVDI
jgi:parallel beta-helix repeat protein